MRSVRGSKGVTEGGKGELDVFGSRSAPSSLNVRCLGAESL